MASGVEQTTVVSRRHSSRFNFSQTDWVGVGQSSQGRIRDISWGHCILSATLCKKLGIFRCWQRFTDNVTFLHMNDVREEMVALLPRLRRFAHGLTANREDADDLVQEACERALGRLDQWQVGTRLDSWMYRIIQNLWYDRLRSRKVRGEQMDEQVLESQADENAHRLPEVRDTFAQVSGLLDRLKPEQREVLMLVCVESYSYQEAADILQIPVGTVMSRLSRARLQLHEDMKKPLKHASKEAS
jgi:RNA polymerase sigma-70 factor, ECF subfamily